MLCRYKDEGVVVSGMGLFPEWGPLAEDSATKLKRGQPGPANCVYRVCVLRMVYSFPPVAEICARLASNFCQ